MTKVQKQFGRERIGFFLAKNAIKTEYSYAKKCNWTRTLHCSEINPKCIKDFHVRLEIIKLIEENIETLIDISHGKDFLI